MKAIIIFFTLFISCSAKKNSVDVLTPLADSIFFVTLKIYNDTLLLSRKIELINKTESVGKMKIQPKAQVNFENKLSVYIYSNTLLTDSIILEHPLYKHYEYIEKFSVKDTIIDQAEFFFRIQKQHPLTSIKITETLKNKTKTELATLKL